MIHRHKEINIDNEIVCEQCGIVLAQTFEISNHAIHLSTANNFKFLENNVQTTQVLTPNDTYYRIQCNKVYNRLHELIEQEHLPISFLNETMRIILARNKGLWSYKWQVMTLIQVLKNIDSIRFRNHIRHLKEVYKHATGT